MAYKVTKHIHIIDIMIENIFDNYLNIPTIFTNNKTNVYFK